MMTLELCLLVEAVQLLEISFWLGLTESMYNLSGKKKRLKLAILSALRLSVDGL